MSSDSLFATFQNSSYACPWMQQKLASELIVLEITDTLTVAASEVSVTLQISPQKW